MKAAYSTVLKTGARTVSRAMTVAAPEVHRAGIAGRPRPIQGSFDIEFREPSATLLTLLIQPVQDIPSRRR
jgi:hypothetical protein